MFYLTSYNYTGNQDTVHDADYIEINTKPARANLSGAEIISGWCGNTNSWSVTAHGVYQTIEEARAAITGIFGEVRPVAIEEIYAVRGEDVVEVCKPGKYEPMTSEHTLNWSAESIAADVTADTTDKQIERLISKYEREANREGFSLHSDILSYMQEHREELHA